MFLTLFNLAGPAALAWVLLIFLPKWRVTQWLARSAVIPALMAVLYVVGIVTRLRTVGLDAHASYTARISGYFQNAQRE
jgi:hypothetical protein